MSTDAKSRNASRPRNRCAGARSGSNGRRRSPISAVGSWTWSTTGSSGRTRCTASSASEPQEFAATYEAFLERVHPDDREAVDAAYSGSIRENRDAYEIEHRVIRKDTGEIRFVHERCQHFRDASGTIIRSVGMVHDITERKRAEEALRKLNAELEERVAAQTAEIRRTCEAVEAERQRFYNVLEIAARLRGAPDAGLSRALREPVLPGAVRRVPRETLLRVPLPADRALRDLRDLHRPEDRKAPPLGVDRSGRPQLRRPRLPLHRQRRRPLHPGDGDRRHRDQARRGGAPGGQRDAGAAGGRAHGGAGGGPRGGRAGKAAAGNGHGRLPVGVAITDARGGNIKSNRAFEEVWGGPRPATDSVADYAAYKAWWADTGEPVRPEEWASARAVQTGETVRDNRWRSSGSTAPTPLSSTAPRPSSTPREDRRQRWEIRPWYDATGAVGGIVIFPGTSPSSSRRRKP